MSAITNAISVDQPWPELIFRGAKRYETRPGPPNGPFRPDGIIGNPGGSIGVGEQIAIHATKKSPQARAVGTYEVSDVDGEKYLDDGEDPPRPLSLGAIIGVVDITAVIPMVDPGLDGLLSSQISGNHIVVTPDRLTLSARKPGFIARLDISDQIPYGDWSGGRWAWVIGTPIRLDQPIPCRGHQGVWALDRSGVTLRRTESGRVVGACAAAWDGTQATFDAWSDSLVPSGWELGITPVSPGLERLEGIRYEGGVEVDKVSLGGYRRSDH